MALEMKQDEVREHVIAVPGMSGLAALVLAILILLQPAKAILNLPIPSDLVTKLKSCGMAGHPDFLQMLTNIKEHVFLIFCQKTIFS